MSTAKSGNNRCDFCGTIIDNELMRCHPKQHMECRSRMKAQIKQLKESYAELQLVKVREIHANLLFERDAEIERLRDYAAGQPCECYNEYGKRLSGPCERCRLLYECESWEEFEKKAERQEWEG